MSSTRDWLVKSHDGQIALAKEWAFVITQNQTKWGIPAGVLSGLVAAVSAASAALEKAKNETTRTPVATAACKTAFEELVKMMRSIKDRYFKLDPLLPEDFVALGLHVKDTVKTPVPPPTAQPTGNITFPGLHLVEISHIGPAAAPSPDKRSDYGVRIYYGFTGPATKTHEYRLAGRPEFGSQLPYSQFTRRGKHRFDFEGESGNTIYICMRYENEKGESGPFGPIIQFVIP